MFKNCGFGKVCFDTFHSEDEFSFSDTLTRKNRNVFKQMPKPFINREAVQSYQPHNVDTVEQENSPLHLSANARKNDSHQTGRYVVGNCLSSHMNATISFCAVTMASDFS